MTSMTDEVVFSPVKDDKISSHLKDSEIWEKAYTLEEFTDEARAKYPAWYEYHIRFDGVVPIQCTKIKEI